jgi:hypothetical protein
MVTSFQYPQYLYALRNEEATQNPNTGSWEAGAGAWELKSICREETNGKGHTVITTDRESIVFSSLIQLPAGTGRINEGTEIMVTRSEALPESLMSTEFVKYAKKSGLIVAQGKCMKFDSGRLHCRLWI